MSTEFNNTQYIKLFSDKEVLWDLEEFNYQSYTYENLFNEEGIISKLKKLVENKELFKKYIRNERINRLIQDKEKTENFLLYYNFLPDRESLKEQKNELEKINKIIKILSAHSN